MFNHMDKRCNRFCGSNEVTMKTTNTEKSLREKKLAEFDDKYQSFELCERICKGDFDKLRAFISDMADEYEAKIDQTKRETVEKICDLIHEDVKKYHADALTDTFLNGKMWEAKELWERLTDLKSHLTDKK